MNTAVIELMLQLPGLDKDMIVNVSFNIFIYLKYIFSSNLSFICILEVYSFYNYTCSLQYK